MRLRQHTRRTLVLLGAFAASAVWLSQRLPMPRRWPVVGAAFDTHKLRLRQPDGWGDGCSTVAAAANGNAAAAAAAATAAAWLAERAAELCGQLNATAAASAAASAVPLRSALFAEATEVYGAVYQLLEHSPAATKHACGEAGVQAAGAGLARALIESYAASNADQDKLLPSLGVLGAPVPIYQLNNHGFAPRYWERVAAWVRAGADDGAAATPPVPLSIVHVDSHFDINPVDLTASLVAAKQRAARWRPGSQGRWWQPRRWWRQLLRRHHGRSRRAPPGAQAQPNAGAQPGPGAGSAGPRGHGSHVHLNHTVVSPLPVGGATAAVVAEDPLCTDANQACAKWAKTGECTSTPTYMMVSCCKSCQARSPHRLRGGDMPGMFEGSPWTWVPQAVAWESQLVLMPRWVSSSERGLNMTVVEVAQPGEAGEARQAVLCMCPVLPVHQVGTGAVAGTGTGAASQRAVESAERDVVSRLSTFMANTPHTFPSHVVPMQVASAGGAPIYVGLHYACIPPNASAAADQHTHRQRVENAGSDAGAVLEKLFKHELEVTLASPSPFLFQLTALGENASAAARDTAAHLGRSNGQAATAVAAGAKATSAADGPRRVGWILDLDLDFFGVPDTDWQAL